MILSQGYDGAYKLVTKAGANVEVDDPVTAGSDGSIWTVTGGRAPHSPASTGRVYVTGPGDREFFPSVFNLVWVKM